VNIPRETALHKLELRSLFSDQDWLSLQSSVVLVCRHAAQGSSDDPGWEKIERALEALAKDATQESKEKNLALAVLASLADDAFRRQLIAKVRDDIADRSEPAVRALTVRSGQLVEAICAEQSFSFRAMLTLVSMEIQSFQTGLDN
jgi:hypothetical protein